MKGRLVPLLLGAMLLAGCSGSRVDAPVGSAPDWTFIDTEGVRHDKAEAVGNVSVLFFIATWCPSCKSVAPRLAHVNEEFAPQGLRVYTLSWDPTEDADDLRKWKDDLHQPWPHGVDEGGAVARAFGVTQQSTVLVLDESAALSKGFGYPGPSEEALRQAVQAALDA